MTDPDLSSERAPHMDRTVTFNQNKDLVMSSTYGEPMGTEAHFSTSLLLK
jgi:hypothetical protein